MGRFTLTTLNSQDQELRFDSVTNEDALHMGLLAVEVMKAYQGQVAVEVQLNRVSVFRYVPEGASEMNLDFIRRKINVVHMTNRSSLHQKCVFAEMGMPQELVESCMPMSDFALSGGAFPLRLKCGTVIGVMAVSGLPEEDDHEIVTTVLGRFIGEKE